MISHSYVAVYQRISYEGDWILTKEFPSISIHVQVSNNDGRRFPNKTCGHGISRFPNLNRGTPLSLHGKFHGNSDSERLFFRKFRDTGVPKNSTVDGCEIRITS